MDKTTLVDRDIENGRRLIEQLDQAQFQVPAALWYFSPDEGLWRLLIASPLVDEKGPREAYQTIQDAITHLGISDLRLDDITVVSPKTPLITELRFYAGTEGPPYVGGTRLRNSRVGEAYIDDAYVYRAERRYGKSGTVDMWSVVPEKGRKVWKAYRAKMIAKDGLIKDVHVEGHERPKSFGKNGVNIHLDVVSRAEFKDGALYGDVQKLSIFDGRLRSVDDVATNVLIEGLGEPVKS
jgi:hypothetical protein